MKRSRAALLTALIQGAFGIVFFCGGDMLSGWNLVICATVWGAAYIVLSELEARR